MKNNLWCEKYRPKVVTDLILPERIKSVILKAVQTGDIPNMLFSGRAGTCKTSTAKAIANTLNAECLIINGSDETGKSDINNKVTPFATGLNLSEKANQRIIIIDEFDRLTGNAQDFLKYFIEECSSNCRFIFTCNTPAKIIEPIKSRCLCFDFNISSKEKPELMASLLNKLGLILNENNIEFDKKPLVHLIYNLFPDYRKIINQLQSYSDAYGKIDEGIVVTNTTDIADEIYKIIKTKNFETIRKWVSETQYSSDDIFNALFLGLRDHVNNKESLPNIVLILAEYQYKGAFVANPVLNTLACCLEISSVCE